MKIKRLILELVFILGVITAVVVIVNTYQIHSNAAKHFAKLQEQYFDKTYEIYKDEIIGNLLIGDVKIETALFREIASRRGMGIAVIYHGHKIHAGNISTQKPLKTYEINLGNNNTALLSLYSLNDQKYPLLFGELGKPLIIEILLIMFGFVYLWKSFNKRLFAPLSDLVINLKNGKLETYIPTHKTILELKELSQTLKHMNVEIQQHAIFVAEANAAKQVAHDIRSPLACLMLSLTNSATLPEEQRTMMRSAIQRITDIVNTLHSKAQNINKVEPKCNEIFMLSSLVDSLISEKRIQLRDKENVSINFNIEESYGLFSRIDAVEFKRVLSNLINNSVESFNNQLHSISVIVSRIDNWVQIQIQDDGEGMSEDVSKHVGKKGFSHGKELISNAGSGLGIYHAIETIKSFNGTIAIDSEIDKGTTITIKLPKCIVPAWFVEEINVFGMKTIVILDDDQSIHNLWRDRFSRLKLNDLELNYFSSGIQFRKYYNNYKNFNSRNILFLIDYELLNQSVTGLDLIEELDIADKSILVTSHYEDQVMRKRANKIGLKMIPKAIAAFVPILLNNSTIDNIIKLPLSKIKKQMNSLINDLIISSHHKLIILDNFVNHAFWKKLSESINIEIELFKNSDELFIWWQSNPLINNKYSLICNYNLIDDVMNGFDVIKLIKAENSSYLIIAESLSKKLNLQFKDSKIRFIPENIFE